MDSVGMSISLCALTYVPYSSECSSRNSHRVPHARAGGWRGVRGRPDRQLLLLTVAISIGSGMELVNVRKLAAVVAALAAVILLGIAAEQDAADAERRGKHGKGGRQLRLGAALKNL